MRRRKRAFVSFPWFIRVGQVAPKLEVALVAGGCDLSRFDSRPDRTVWLRFVGTILELAGAQEGPELRKTAVEVLGRQPPEPDLSKPRRVDHESAPLVVERNQDGADRRMSP